MQMVAPRATGAHRVGTIVGGSLSSAASHRQSRLSVQLAKVGTSTSVVLGGDLDALTAPELDGIIGGVIALDDGSVTVDLSGLGFMGAAGARSLLSAHRELTEVGRKLDLIDAPPTVARLLAIVGLQVVETLP